MLEENRIYEHQGRRYAIAGNVIILDETSGLKNKIESVIYYAFNADDGTIDKSEKFIRSRQDFIEKFKPIALLVGDEVIGMSMGRIVEVLKITEVEDTIAKCEKENLTFSRTIAPNGSVELVSKGDNNTIEYYFADEASERKLIRRKEVGHLIRRIKRAAEKLEDENYQNFSVCELTAKALDIENFVVHAHNTEE